MSRYACDGCGDYPCERCGLCHECDGLGCEYGPYDEYDPYVEEY